MEKFRRIIIGVVVAFLLVILAVVLYNSQMVNCESDETILVNLNDLIQNSHNPSLTVYYTDDFLISTRLPVPAEELVYGGDYKHRFDLFDLNEYTEHIEKFGGKKSNVSAMMIVI